MELPPPVQSLSVETISIAAPGRPQPIVQSIRFAMEAGQGVGIIGPSASGKSTLARGVVGVWPLLKGQVRLDGAALDQWSARARGKHIGYLPQDIELLDGTVAENISRFDGEADSTAIIAAATAANVHEMILRLPDGYQTRIGESGAALSTGQRQRVALARALYGDPFLVVLDEPNSDLDAEGEAALTAAIKGVRERGGVVLVIAHRPSAIAAVDLLAVMANGTMQAFGPKDEVLRKIGPQASPVARPSGLTVVPEAAEQGSAT
ncbi:MAG: hypothetical protein BGP06_21600 [Rhizobiales bacterium 65-9]|nr:ATP-binding cassette domain-containing protein [Hyphomicrobiales bacterium]OJY39567.1 MAG: hypothetical protein BGP06_21600 [Rhizobiales bacterium 65-9]